MHINILCQSLIEEVKNLEHDIVLFQTDALVTLVNYKSKGISCCKHCEKLTNVYLKIPTYQKQVHFDVVFLLNEAQCLIDFVQFPMAAAFYSNFHDGKPHRLSMQPAKCTSRSL